MRPETADPKKKIDLPFEEHFKSSAGAFRCAILDLMSAMGADPHRPQEVARKFGLRSGLAWKVCKVVQEADVHDSVAHIPGPAGMKLFLDAVEKAGAPMESVKAAREAAHDFERMVHIHTGDRTTLEMMVSDIRSTPAQAEQIRKLAYQGNSGTYGVRARVQLAVNILAPSTDQPGQCDLTQVGGLLGFRRLRPGARWLLFRRESWTDAGLEEKPGTWEPLDPANCAGGAPLLTQFCSTPLPQVDLLQDVGEVQFELPPGPVGNAAALTCIYGCVLRAAGSAFAEGPGEYTDLGLNVITPAQHLLFDLFVHRDFEWAMQPELLVCSRMDGGPVNEVIRRERNLLPVAEEVRNLGWGITNCATSIFPRYRKLLETAFGQLACDPGDFQVFRVAMQYPPIPTVVLLRLPLPLRKS